MTFAGKSLSLLFALPVLLPVAESVFAGALSDRLELTLKRVLRGGPPRYTQDFLLADVVARGDRRFTNFSGDLSGRYIGALASTARRNPLLLAELEPLVEQVLQRQNEDGHFGDAMGRRETRDDDMARLWGNGRLLIGLLEYYKAAGHAPALEAANKIGGFLVEAAPRFNAPSLRRFFLDGKFAVGYICWTQNIEGLAELYRRTLDDRYLRLAEQMAERIERRPSQHSHGFLSSLRGLVDLARVANKPSYLQQAEKEWQAIVDSGNLLAQGAIPEAFFPGVERDEGCSQGDWIRLGLDLWRETGKRKYIEQAEKTLFNEFALNQFASGDFGHIKLRETGIGPETARAWWCCTLHGLRTFPAVESSVFRLDDGALYYDLPVDGFFESAGLRISANSSLERDKDITLSVAEATGARTRLAVRLPPWAASIRVAVGEEPQQVRAIDGYLHVETPLRPGAEIRLSYDLVTRVQERFNGYAAVFHGPWLLGVAESSTPSFFDEPYQHNRVVMPPLDEGRDGLSASGKADPTHSFRAPAARLAAEWIPAGYRSQPQSAVLRPLAEATGEALPTRWEFWFRTAEPVEKEPPSPTATRPRRNRRFPVDLGGALIVIAAIAFLLRRRHRDKPRPR